MVSTLLLRLCCRGTKVQWTRGVEMGGWFCPRQQQLVVELLLPGRRFCCGAAFVQAQLGGAHQLLLAVGDAWMEAATHRPTTFRAG